MSIKIRNHKYMAIWNSYQEKNPLRVTEDGVLAADMVAIKALVAATGLRSKKKRLILKRFKAFMNQALEAYIEQEKLT